MDTAEFLTREQQTIIDGAKAALVRAHSPHYESADASEVRQRLEEYDVLLVVEGLAVRTVSVVIHFVVSATVERVIETHVLVLLMLPDSA